MQEEWRKRIEAMFPQMVRWRRDFHQYPELSFQEERTSKRVAEWLEHCGLQVRTGVGGNGVVGVLEGSSGPTIALRADMDALAIQDQKSCEYHSRVPGVMHACGHDAHTATLMGVASLLASRRQEIPGKVVFIFQHAEEQIPGGAAQMIADGVLDGVDAIYGVHLWTPLPCGVVGLRQGPLMAAADSFTIEVIGKGGHGGLPHETVDAVTIASHLVVNLQTIISRQVDPLKSGVISVGRIQGGRAFNVIAERCELEGTVRTFDPQLRRWVHERIEEVAVQTCRMFGADCRVESGFGYPTLVNDRTEAHRLAQVAREMLGNEQVWEIPEMMAGEDFAYYLQKIPGAFCFVGAGNPEEGIHHPHHHPLFDLDERSMIVSAELLIRGALAYLNADRDQAAV
ncbi:M20 metallopeptidase family protein [Desmospora profundinema]|uniref:Amidohydrolase n=1 Tax=Desmospora profundinema TaxID=1571184 RepID=A0ABU1IKJ0_9BACL|nr:amidohydrolase [Desmospora profundinema]MDR6225304.1 amidohydrolase [Desmospora profundinema]